MKADFDYKTNDRVVFRLELTLEEMNDCVNNNAGSRARLVDTLSAACREDAETMPNEYDEASEQPAETAEKKQPFKAKAYMGVQIKRIIDTEDGLSSEDLMKQAAILEIINNNDIWLSEEEIEAETSQTFIGISQNLKYQAMMTGDYTAFNQFQSARSREEVRENVISHYKTEKILKSIIEQEQLDATLPELEAEAAAMARRETMSLDMIKTFFGDDLLMIKNDLLKKKAMDLIFDSAIIVEE